MRLLENLRYFRVLVFDDIKEARELREFFQWSGVA
jgi:hypothetical protein